MSELASMDIESLEDLKYVCSQISDYTKAGTPIEVWVSYEAGFRYELRVADKNESKRARKFIGHLFNAGRSITVVIIEREENDVGR